MQIGLRATDLQRYVGLGKASAEAMARSPENA